MRKFAEFVIKYRIGIIIGTVIITAFMAIQLKNLEINSDILSYLPQTDPHVILFNEVGDKFGGNSLAMIALETDDVFNFNTINRINIITQKFKEMPEISFVTSMTDVIDIKKIEGGVEIGKLIDDYDSLADKDELARIKEYVLSKEMYRGNIVSNDGTIAVIVIRLKDDSDKVAIGRVMKEFVLSTEGNEKLYFAGIPFQMIFLTDIISSDIIILLPIVLILLIITLAVSFRIKRGVILPLATVIISTSWGLGLMSLLGIKLTLASDAMPILLLAIGSAYGIHFVNKYMEDIRKGDNKIEGIKDTISEIGMPIFLAGLTTAIGFLAFLTSNLTIIKEFGLFTAIGVFFAFIVSITFLPALLALMPPPKKMDNLNISKNASSNHFLKGLSVLILKRKNIIVLIGFIIGAIGVFSLFHISREVNMVEYFKKDSEIRQAEDMMQVKLGGSIPIQILVKGDLKEPSILKEMIKLEKYLQSLPDVHDPQSIADLICEMNYVMNDRYCIPDTREGVANPWFFLEGNEILLQLINSQNNEGLIQAKLGTVDTKRVRYITDNIEKYISENIDPQMVSVNFTEAEFIESKYLNQYIVRDILENISYDAAHYDLEINDTNALNRILEKYIYQDTPINWTTLTQNLSEKLTDYFNNEESDLIIESTTVREKTVASIVDYIKQNQNCSEEDIISLLEKTVPVSYYDEDPEMLDYAAMSIAAIIENETEWYKVNSILADIAPLISEDLNLHPDFKKKLIGDIWKINDTQIAIPLSLYEKLNDQPDTPVTMNFQQTGLPIIYKDIDQNIVSSQTFSLIFA
ncbi:MMPL family transporter, partial [bacterium]|nr:MMPL family transporter [bacterium]